jgi:hypothetical protein
MRATPTLSESRLTVGSVAELSPSSTWRKSVTLGQAAGQLGRPVARSLTEPGQRQ